MTKGNLTEFAAMSERVRMATEDVTTTPEVEAPQIDLGEDVDFADLMERILSGEEVDEREFTPLIKQVDEELTKLSRRKTRILGLRTMATAKGEKFTTGGESQTGTRTRIDKTKQRMAVLKFVKEGTEAGDDVKRPYVDEKFYEFFGQDRNTTPVLNELVKEELLDRPERGKFVITEKGDALLSEYKGFDAQTADDVITGGSEDEE